ncbi:MAG: TIGR02453 family protein [Bacteroidetes bacterium]|nr:TIGR02453 family protein [Bacteroidota bacterium]
MKSVIPFLRKLKKNNQREWFQANKKDYESAKQELSTFLDGLIEELQKTDPELNGLQAKDCMFRIFRDTRFSKNKDPYKTNMGAVIAPGGRKSEKALYYFHIDPDGCFLAGGSYKPESKKLNMIRQEIDYNLDEFNAILEDPEFKKFFSGLDQRDRLKNAPKGYDPDSPAIDYLKNKSFIVSYPFDVQEIESESFQKFCLKVYGKMKPLNDFLNRATDLS